MTVQQTSHARRTAPRATPRGRLRLTSRGRLAVVLLITILALAAFSIGRITSSKAATPQHYRTVVVGSGQTLWAFASALAPNSDPRVTVTQLEALNHLPSPELVAGQQLRLPE